ncbi:MAG: TonB-dependent receptor [Gammaproteobacteria bacterium]|nr:TonB-dependent receptor [Gammaproteobacteria bacterium]
MKYIISIIGGLSVALIANFSMVQASYGAEAGATEEVIVTGSRIRQDPVDEKSPILIVDQAEIERTGLTSIGDFLQRLSVSGSTLNTRFNSSGNFGFPPDGSGIGAGASQVDLRHLSSKRVLVLVDGIRWVNGSSASGVAAATDLNTIPVSIIDKIEVLEDGASTIYGSDAIAGVVNIITKKDYDGFGISAYTGDFSEGGGTTNEYSLSMGSSDDDHSTFFNFSYTSQDEIRAADVAQARESAGPGTANLHGSSGTPQGRYVFEYTPITDPNGDALFINATLNDSTGSPFFDPSNPLGFTGFVQNGVDDDMVPIYDAQFGSATDDYHAWSNDDRFNFAPFNLVVTPSERTAIYGQSDRVLTGNTRVYVKGLYNNRKSTNQAAPEPLFIGSDAGNGNILDTIDIDVTNPFNPFGISIIAADQAYFMGRRPLEGGPRVFKQDVDTWYTGAGLTGEFEAADRDFFWDVNVAWSRNQANQIKTGGYNARKLKTALGPAFMDGGTWRCGTPGNEVSGCVPFNFFGGQGADGSGTITQEMLSWVAFTQQDSSEQELVDFTANISGDLVEMPGGALAFAAGIEHREQDGTFQPDSIVVAGDSAGIPALPTSGGFDVDEFYAEVLVPLLSDQSGADLLELSAAARRSDYSTFGSDSTTKFGVRWRPTEDLLIRANLGEGLRAPSIGELFGSRSRFDATIADPCSDFLDESAAVQANCIDNGVPSDGSYVQLGGQISVLTGGNRALQPETVDSTTFGVVYSPSWVDDIDWLEGLTVEAMYYEHDLDNAIQAVDAQTTLDSCANSGEAQFCDAIGRTGSGVINRFINQLTNIGGIETDGWDLNIGVVGPDTGIGQFSAQWRNTFLNEYTEILVDPSSPSGFQRRSLEGIEENDRGKPEWKSTLVVDWLYGDWSAAWTMRYIDEQSEACSDFLDGTADDPSPDSLTSLGLCSQPHPTDDSLSMNKLDATMFNDFQVTYTPGAWGEGISFTLGINNIFEEDPPACYSCSLNGYDPSTYDNPGRFTYIRANWKR